MTNLKNKVRMGYGRKGRKSNKGFTLIELILVIIILGIMAVGISSFITLSTQTYLNATNRDELIGNARFVIERLSRELKNAVPNSIRTASFGPYDCIQFTPIVASTVYTDIPVSPEQASKILKVIPFNGDDGTPYKCDIASAEGCDDLVIVYPLNKDDIWNDHLDDSGKMFPIESIDRNVDPWQIKINNTNKITFTEDSPTQRLYITNRQVSYCTFPTSIGGFVIRFRDLITKGEFRPGSNSFIMAGYLKNDLSDHAPFNYQPATLKRNAVIQIHLPFTKEGENYVFDHEVHINNVP